MSHMLASYRALIATGRSHYEAVRQLARDYLLDEATVGRVLRRAEADEHRHVPRKRNR